MQLFIRSFADQIQTLQVAGSETIADVKAQISAVESIPEDELVVYFAGKPLSNEMVLAECASDQGTLEVEVRMLGGKVHGSLARAGKVKGQTPKVDPQEKKKKKTGRAKRRIQYNRRFVNVVATFGKRRGPNSNS